MSFDSSLGPDVLENPPGFKYVKPMNCRIGIVTARFNRDFCQESLDACLAAFRSMGVPPGNITVHGVPGALEIPVVLDAVCENLHPDALVAIGCVIRGETYHFELVSDVSAKAIMDVSLKHGVPVANAIMTVENREQAKARTKVKGAEAAVAALVALDAIMATENGADGRPFVWERGEEKRGAV